MNTRRYPRTLQEAFGPYTSREIHEPSSGETPAWWAAVVCIAAVGLLIAWVTR